MAKKDDDDRHSFKIYDGAAATQSGCLMMILTFGLWRLRR